MRSHAGAWERVVKSSGRVTFALPWSLKDRRDKYTFIDCKGFHAMQTTRPLGIYSAAPVVLWGARILSVPILLFWGWFLIAHLFGEEGRPSRPLVAKDYAILTGVVVSLVGLAVAWKWELPGAALTLAAVSAGAFVNWRLLTFPGTLIPVAAVMFLTYWWMSRPPRNE